jgi:glycosyltransferase involved in cell wall biosynthesis
MKEAYSFFSRFYMRHSIKFSCRWAKKIIAVSKNTKKDLMELYGIPQKKIEVIYEGVGIEQASKNGEQYEQYKPYLLFVGRLEKRKNIIGIISAYKILKEKYNIPHKLILAGNVSFGYEEIKDKIEKSEYKNEIIEVGFVKEQEKYELIKNTDVFLFPTFYEGFGLPILEAQNLGVPVVTSNISSLPEVGGNSVAYCTPEEPTSIATAIYEVVSDESFKNGIIKKGYENVAKFSWEKCANQIAELLNG